MTIMRRRRRSTKRMERMKRRRKSGKRLRNRMSRNALRGGFRGKVAKLGQGKPPDPEEPACFQCEDNPTRMPTRIKKIKWYQYGSARLKAAAGLRVCSKDWCHEKCYKSLVKVRA